MQHFFYLAPIRGITDALFRNVYHNHFPYFDGTIAPFINPQRFANFKDKYIADILPENNFSIPVVPQLIYNNAEDFIVLGKRLENFGYSHINWNLGCPAPMVANKNRGSGFLPHTESILKMLEEILSNLKADISIKTRLGFKDSNDIARLLPQLEAMPLKEIIIHPRIGKQLYRGSADQDAFDQCRKMTRHNLVYNGDIITAAGFISLAEKFPDVNRWMIGRGALANPFLLAEIKKIAPGTSQRKEALISFHEEIYGQIKAKLSGPGHLLNKMKQIWTYLIESFPDKKKILKKIRKASSERAYQIAIDELFE